MRSFTFKCDGPAIGGSQILAVAVHRRRRVRWVSAEVRDTLGWYATVWLQENVSARRRGFVCEPQVTARRYSFVMWIPTCFFHLRNIERVSAIRNAELARETTRCRLVNLARIQHAQWLVALSGGEEYRLHEVGDNCRSDTGY